jgi:hypothetical protein
MHSTSKQDCNNFLWHYLFLNALVLEHFKLNVLFELGDLILLFSGWSREQPFS